MKRTRRLIVAILCIALLVASTLLVVSACESKYELTFALGDHAASGAQVPDKQTLAPGETITLPQAPDAEDGWEFDGWGSDKLAAGSEYQMPESDTTLTAQWKQINTYAVTITKTPEEGGTVSLDPQQDAYFEDTKVVATVTPAANFAVKSVKANGSDITPNSDGKYEFTVSEATTLAVEFEQTVFAVSASVNYEDGAELSLSSTSAKNGDTVTLSVTVKEGYVLESVKVGGQAVNANDDGDYEVTVSGNTEFVVTLGKVVEVTASVFTEGSGTVTLSDPTHNGKYYAGDEVTISFEVDDAYDFETLAINDDDVDPEQIVEGSYTFTATEDTEVVLYANKKVISADLLQSLSGSLSLTGSRTDSDRAGELDDDVYSLRVIFDDDQEAVYWEMLYEGQPAYVLLAVPFDASGFPGYEEYDGTVAAVTHDVEGSITWFFITIDDAPIPFEDVTNPFDGVLGTDFTFVEDGVWEITDQETAVDIFYRLTGFDAEIASLRLYEEDGTFVKLEIVTADEESDDGVVFNSTYVFTLGTDVIPAEWLDDYSEDIADADLAAAFNKAASATSYKASYSYTYYDENGSEQTDEGNELVTAQAIYDDMLSSGVFKRADGSCWEFTYEDETFTTGEQYYYAFAECLAQFGDFNLSMMEKVDDNTYRYRFIDSYMLTSYLDEYGDYIGVCYMAYPVPLALQGLFDYAGSLTITLDEEGNIATVVFDTSDGEHVEVTFSGWNSTTLPFEIPASEVEGAVPVEMVGVWTDETGAYEFEITIDGTVTAYIEGEEYSGKLTESEEVEGGYSVFLDNAEFVFAFDEDGTFYCYLGGIIPVELAQCNWGILFGSYYGEADSGESYLVDITFKGIMITVDGGEPVAVTDIEFGTGLDWEIFDVVFSFSFTYNNKSYLMETYGSYEGKMLFLAPEDYQTPEEIVALQQVVSDWSDCEGTFRGFDEQGVEYSIVISAADKSVTLTIGEDEQSLDALLLWVVDTDNEEFFVRFEFTVDGVFGVIVPYEGGFIVYNTAALGSPVYLGKVGYSADWSSFIGEWSGTSTSNVKYAVNITADQVTLAVGEGEAVEAIVLVYDDVDGFTLSVNGEIYYIQVARDGLVHLYGSTGYSLATLYKSGLITPEYQGTWYTVFGEYVAVIDADNIVISDLAAEDVSKTDAGYSFTWGGIDFTLTLEDGVLTLASEMLSEPLQFVHCDFGEYLGIWNSGTAYGYATHSHILAVAANGQVVLVTAQGQQIGSVYNYGLSESNNTLILRIQIDSALYQLQYANSDGTAIAMFDMATRVRVTYLWKEYSEDVELDDIFSYLPAEFFGEDSNGVSYKVEISEEGVITVTVGTQSTVAVIESIYRTMDYFYEIPYGTITMKLGENDAQMIVGCSEGYLTLYIDGVIDEGITLVPDYYELDWSCVAGVYEGYDVENFTDYAITITEEKVFITIDGQSFEAKVLFLDMYEGLTLSADGDLYFFFWDDTFENFYLSDAVNFFVRVERTGDAPEPELPCEWEDYLGTWSVTDESGVTYTVVIDRQSLHVSYGDVEFDVTPDNDRWQYNKALVRWIWSYNGETWHLDESDGKLKLYYGSASDFDVYLERQQSGSVSQWQSMIGDWEGNLDDTDGTYIYVQITEDEVWVTRGEDGPFKALDITVKTLQLGLQLEFTVDGVGYTLAETGQGTLRIYDEDWYEAFLTKREGQGSTEWPSKFVGEYEGTASDGTKYALEITADAVYLTIDDGDTVMATATYRTDEDGYIEIEVKGIVYTIQDMTYAPDDGSVSVIFMMSSDYSVRVTLNRVEESLGIPAGFIGDWEGTFEDLSLDIELSISETGIKVNGTDATNINVDGNTITFSVGSFDYTLTLTDNGIHIVRVFFDEPIEADLVRKAA